MLRLCWWHRYLPVLFQFLPPPHSSNRESALPSALGTSRLLWDHSNHKTLIKAGEKGENTPIAESFFGWSLILDGGRNPGSKDCTSIAKTEVAKQLNLRVESAIPFFMNPVVPYHLGILRHYWFLFQTCWFLALDEHVGPIAKGLFSVERRL